MTTRNLATSVDDWADAGVHTPMLPSGKRVKIRIPDLADMVESGEIPQHLLDVAIGAVNNDVKVDRELVVQQKEFTDLIVRKTVVEPELTEDTVKKVPVEDKEMLVSFATRQRDLDAISEHLGGLDTYEKFRKFRRLGEFDSDVEGLPGG